VFIFPSKDGEYWWTNARFNNSEKKEPALSISKEDAVLFLQDEGDGKKDPFMEKYFPNQMRMYHEAIATARKQFEESIGVKV